MPSLKIGSSGEGVTRLQRKLAEVGFDPEGVDGVFGTDTATAGLGSQMEIRQALAADDPAKARKLVNGGSHGLDRFTDTFNKGKALLS